jgi:Icc-related predicted phosphoesterase
MNFLAVSDKESHRVYSDHIKHRFCNVDLAFGCGDLSYFYLEYIISTLDIPLYYVRGNHAPEVEYGIGGSRKAPWGAINLHKKVVRDCKTGLLLAGIEGSLKYNAGKHQYSQNKMLLMVFKLVPALLYNKIRYGRYLDIFITHAPPWGIHDQKDRPHQGIRAFKWFIKIFQPAYHLHGHVHVIKPGTVTETKLGKTRIINTFGYKVLSIKPGQSQTT